MVNREEPGRFERLLRIDEVEDFVLGPHTRASHLNLMRGGEPVPRDDYVFPSGIVDALAVARHFDQGAAIVLPRANESFDELSYLVRGLEAELGCRAQTNAYLSPPGASAFVPHYDSHDVIAVQAFGSKAWKIFESPWPVRPTVDFDKLRDQAGPESMAFTTHQGDCCYLPQGVMHDAVSDGVSLHITVGIHWLRTAEVLAALVSQANDRLPDLHHVVPPAWWLEEADADAVVAQVQAALGAMQDADAIRSCLRFLREDLVATRQPLVPGQMHQLASLDRLDGETQLAVRDPLLWDYTAGDEGVRLSVYGNDILLPPAAGPIVEALLALPRSGATLASLDVDVAIEEVVVVARRLVQEGVLEILTEPGSAQGSRPAPFMG